MRYVFKIFLFLFFPFFLNAVDDVKKEIKQEFEAVEKNENIDAFFNLCFLLGITNIDFFNSEIPYKNLFEEIDSFFNLINKKHNQETYEGLKSKYQNFEENFKNYEYCKIIEEISQKYSIKVQLNEKIKDISDFLYSLKFSHNDFILKLNEVKELLKKKNFGNDLWVEIKNFFSIDENITDVEKFCNQLNLNEDDFTNLIEKINALPQDDNNESEDIKLIETKSKEMNDAFNLIANASDSNFYLAYQEILNLKNRELDQKKIKEFKKYRIFINLKEKFNAKMPNMLNEFLEEKKASEKKDVSLKVLLEKLDEELEKYSSIYKELEFDRIILLNKENISFNPILDIKKIYLFDLFIHFLKFENGKYKNVSEVEFFEKFAENFECCNEPFFDENQLTKTKEMEIINSFISLKTIEAELKSLKYDCQLDDKICISVEKAFEGKVKFAKDFQHYWKMQRQKKTSETSVKNTIASSFKENEYDRFGFGIYSKIKYAEVSLKLAHSFINSETCGIFCANYCFKFHNDACFFVGYFANFQNDLSQGVNLGLKIEKFSVNIKIYAESYFSDIANPKFFIQISKVIFEKIEFFGEFKPI